MEDNFDILYLNMFMTP